MDEKKSKKRRKTNQLKGEKKEGVPVAGGAPFGTKSGEVKFFLSLPAHLSRSGQSISPVRWRIILNDLGSGKAPLGLDVLGDVVLGRGRMGNLAPDLDMETYDAHKLGVSRRHALLRPTANNLYIIDLGSTNGTFHNGVRLGPGVARVLAHDDTLSFGNLGITITIVERPKVKLPIKREIPLVGKKEKPDDTKPFESTPEAIADGLPPGSPLKLVAMKDDEEEVATLIVRPAVLQKKGKISPDRPSEKKKEEKPQEPAKAPDEEKAKPTDKKPEKADKAAKAQGKDSSPKAKKAESKVEKK